MSTALNRCPVCDASRPVDSPGSLCPRCLMRLGLAEDAFDPDEIASLEHGRATAVAIERSSTRSEPLTAEPHPSPTVVEVHPEPIVRFVAIDELREEDRGDRLRLLEVIARGGMGVIHRGRDPDLNRDVAVKILQEKHRDHPDLVRRFVAEAQITGQLQHPGVVPVYELGVFDDRRPYFAMKLVRGQTLAEILGDQAGPDDDRHRLLPIFLQVAQTVAYAHAHGVVHGDLSPSNVMVGKYGEVQVMDWGLAEVVSGGTPAEPGTESGTALSAPDVQAEGTSRPRRVMGTPGYMAPERLDGDVHRIDARADVFALGSILCEILTGRPAYAGVSPRKLQDQTLQADLADAHARLGGCADAELVGLTRDCLAANPALRPRDAGELAERLKTYLDGVVERLRVAELGRIEAQARAVEERKRRRLTALLAVLSAALVALVVGGYAEWLQRREARQNAANQVLREVEILRDRAATDPTGDAARWRAAYDSILRVGQLLTDASQQTRRRLTVLTAEVDRGLEQAEADHRLLEKLESARFLADQWDQASAVAQFEAALREAGLDPDNRDPASIGRSVDSRPQEVKGAIVAALDCWSIMTRGVPRHRDDRKASWKTILASARAADPDPWRNQLRTAMETFDAPGVAQLARDADLEKQSTASLWLMGRSLFWTGQREQAIGWLTRAWRIHPQDFWINLDLSLMHRFNPPRFDLALNYASGAVILRSESPAAHLRRADIQEMRGDWRDAEFEYRTALRLRPDYGPAYSRFALMLFSHGRFAEAVEAYRAAMRFQPDRAHAVRSLLGTALVRLRRFEEAVTVLEESTRHVPSDSNAWIQLGRVRVAQRDVPKAEEAFRRAEALIKPGSSGATALAQARKESERLRRLLAVLRGEDHPRDDADRLEFARFCDKCGLAAAGARLYAEAIAADPKIAEDRTVPQRARGALLAAWAGCGRSRDESAPNPAERARLRRQALDWLRAELSSWTPALKDRSSSVHSRAVAALNGWMIADELAGVRDPKSLADLAPDERDAWQTFWRDVKGWLPDDPG